MLINKLNFLQWNIRSYNSNRPYLQKCIDILNPSIICLQETNLKPTNNISLPNFHYPPIRHDRDEQRGGGTAIFIKSELPYLKINHIIELELTAAKVFTNDKHINIFCLYLPPTLNNTIIKTEIEKLKQQMVAPFILCMDANAHHPYWGSSEEKTDTRGNMLAEWIDENPFILLNTGEPTHISTIATFTHIDITICSPDLAAEIDWEIYPDPMNSDHLPINIGTSIYTTTEQLPKWNINKANWKLFQDNIDLSHNFESANDACKKVTENLIKSAKIAIPQSSTAPKRPSAYWWTKECTTAKKNQTKCLGKYKNHPGNIDLWIKFKKARAIFRKVTIAAKQTSWTKFLNNFTSNTNSSTVWKQTKMLKNKPQTRTIILKIDENYITDKKEISNVLAKHFSNRSNGEYNDSSFSKHKKLKEKNELKIDKENDNENYNKPFTINEFLHALRTCKSKSPGPDSLPYSFITNLTYEQQLQLLNFYNYIYNTGYPDQWKEGLVISLKKPTKLPTSCDAYRPITLTNTLAKLLGKMVNRRLQGFLETKKYFSNVQSGFVLPTVHLTDFVDLNMTPEWQYLTKNIASLYF